MKKQAFTFVELLIALTIFSIIAASIYVTLNSGFSLWSKVNFLIQENQEVRIFFDVLSKDLRNAVSPFGVESDFEVVPEWKTDSLPFQSGI